MSPTRRAVATLCLLCSLPQLPAESLPGLPSISGNLSGTVAISGAAPQIRWSLQSAGPGSGGLPLQLRIEAGGTHLVANVKLTGPEEGTWSLEPAALEIGTWLPVLATAFPALHEWTASGEITVSGSGRLRDGRPSGAVSLEWKKGSLRSADGSWLLEGIGFAGDFSIDGATWSIQGKTPFELHVTTITTRRFGARAFRLSAMLGPKRTLQVSRAAIEIAGGEVSAEPSELALSPFAVKLALHLDRVGLQDVAALVPSALSEARGRVDGVVNLSWSKSAGFKLGAGHLSVRKDEPAQVRLASFPGLISSSLPASVLKYYPGLGQIETGQTPLRAQRLDVTLTPDGDSEGRTALVQLEGGPVDPKLRAPVELTINVRGPLDALLKLGTTPGLKIGGGK